jgi:hypothetical protein
MNVACSGFVDVATITIDGTLGAFTRPATCDGPVHHMYAVFKDGARQCRPSDARERFGRE